MIHWSGSGDTPFYVYDSWVDNTLSAPIGQSAGGDQERYSSPQAQSLINKYESASTDAQRTAAIQGLELLTADQLPVVPLLYGVVFGEYSTQHFTGWPSPANPYATLGIGFPDAEVVITHLEPTS
jgi:peptide/nickel transport system substrate-binding protein